MVDFSCTMKVHRSERYEKASSVFLNSIGKLERTFAMNLLSGFPPQISPSVSWMTGPDASFRPGGWPRGGSVQRDVGVGGARENACGAAERKCGAIEDAIGVGEEALGVGEDATTDDAGERNETPRCSEAVEALDTLESSDQLARLSTAAV